MEEARPFRMPKKGHADPGQNYIQLVQGSSEKAPEAFLEPANCLNLPKTACEDTVVSENLVEQESSNDGQCKLLLTVYFEIDPCFRYFDRLLP